MELVYASMFISMGIVGYAYLMSNKQNVLVKRDDNTICKCHSCTLADKCSIFPSKDNKLGNIK